MPDSNRHATSPKDKEECTKSRLKKGTTRIMHKKKAPRISPKKPLQNSRFQISISKSPDTNKPRPYSYQNPSSFIPISFLSSSTPETFLTFPPATSSPLASTSSTGGKPLNKFPSIYLTVRVGSMGLPLHGQLNGRGAGRCVRKTFIGAALASASSVAAKMQKRYLIVGSFFFSR